jgi:hypothetical protein
MNITVYNVPDEMGIQDVAHILDIWGRVNQDNEAWEFKTNNFGQPIYVLYGFEFHTSQGRQWSQSLIASLHQGVSISTDVDGIARISIMELFEPISNINHWELLRQIQNLRLEVETRDNLIADQSHNRDISNIIEDDDENENSYSREIEFWKDELKYLITCSDVEWSGYMPPVALGFDENEEYTIQPCLREHVNL